MQHDVGGEGCGLGVKPIEQVISKCSTHVPQVGVESGFGSEDVKRALTTMKSLQNWVIDFVRRGDR